MAINVKSENDVKDIGEAVSAYMLGKLPREETGILREAFRDELNIAFGQWLVFRFPILDVQSQDIVEREWALRCPGCGKPTLYFVQEFGPACLGDCGGCGLKAPFERRMWYVPPYVHKDDKNIART